MSVEPSEVRDKISRMSDEELLLVVGVDARQYRPEAIEYARAEITKRGLTPDAPANSVRCGKCEGVMEEGFIPDFGHYEYVKPLRWVEGQPERSFWSGTKVGDRRNIKVSAYRCASCGYLEFYANEEAPSERDLA